MEYKQLVNKLEEYNNNNNKKFDKVLRDMNIYNNISIVAIVLLIIVATISLL